MSEILNHIESDPEKEKTSVKFFGEPYDSEMLSYAKLVKRFNDLMVKDAKDDFDNVRSWQQSVKEVDTNRKVQHDKVAKLWTQSEFFNGTYNILNKNESYDERFKSARLFAKKIGEKVYLRILGQDITSTKMSHTDKDIIENFNKLKAEGFIINHGIEDLRSISNESVNNKIVFNQKVDNAIKEFLQSNRSFESLITRYDPQEEKSKEFIKNADENKTDKHRDIVIALIETGLLPEVDREEWLHVRWQNKSENKIRQIAENFAMMYVDIQK